MEKKINGIIYVATNKINGKSYIGQTSKMLGGRRYAHEWDSEKGSQCVFHRALRKYGFENFEWSVLWEGSVSRLVLGKLETDFIKEYNSKVPNGYNMTDGGEGCSGYIHTEETIRVIVEKRKLQVCTCETRKKLSYTRLNSVSCRNVYKSKSRSAKISAAHKGRPKSDSHKAALSAAKKGKTWEQIFGVEKASEMRVL